MAAKKPKTRTVRVVRTFDRRADTHTYVEVDDDYSPVEGETVIDIEVPAEED